MSKSHDCIECLAKSWKDGDIETARQFNKQHLIAPNMTVVLSFAKQMLNRRQMPSSYRVKPRMICLKSDTITPSESSIKITSITGCHPHGQQHTTSHLDASTITGCHPHGQQHTTCTTSHLDASTITAAALHTDSCSGGPSGTDARGWRWLYSSFQSIAVIHCPGGKKSVHLIF